MSIVYEGLVEKCGPRICPTWHKRWLTLYDSRVMEYFTDKEKQTLKGIIELGGTEDVKIDGDPGKTYTFGFYLETDSRTYKFAAQSALKRSQWVKALRDVISGKLQQKIFQKRLEKIQQQSQEVGNGLDITKDLLKNVQLKKRTQSGATTLSFNQFKNYSHNFKQTNSRESVDDNIIKDGRTIHGSLPPPKVGSANSQLTNVSADLLNSLHNDDVKSNDALVPLTEYVPSVFEDGKTIDDLTFFTIVSYLIDSNYGNDFVVLFQLNKYFRNKLSNNMDLYDKYSFYLYPLHVLKRFSTKRMPSRPWIMSHSYKQIWVFGNVERMSYSHLDLNPFKLNRVRKVFIDDPELWGVYADEIEDILYYLQNNEKTISDLTIRCWKTNPGWLKQLPKLRQVTSLSLEFRFQRDILNRNIINPQNIIYLSLRRIDLITDGIIDDISLRVAFKSLTQLLVCNLDESRWEYAIVLPPQLKILRYVPSDKSEIDVTRLLEENDESDSDDENTEMNDEYDEFGSGTSQGYGCELIIKHDLWPHILNHHMICGHEAYSKRKIRVWVLKRLRRWDEKLLFVNYCDRPPPLSVFKHESCYNELAQLDELRDMSHCWTSKNSDYYKHLH